jgi:hypothetical protein
MVDSKSQPNWLFLRCITFGTPLYATELIVAMHDAVCVDYQIILKPEIGQILLLSSNTTQKTKNAI